MSPNPEKGYHALRYGRTSEAGFSYFVTFCSAQRKPGLHLPDIADALHSESAAMQAQKIWDIRCATFMPDHLHLLITLGAKLPLGKTIARLKARTTRLLRDAGIAWQAGYFDHRLRSGEDLLPYFYYIYLNPYRAGLIRSDQEWPWFICESSDKDWFLPLLDRNRPDPEWLAKLP